MHCARHTWEMKLLVTDLGHSLSRPDAGCVQLVLFGLALGSSGTDLFHQNRRWSNGVHYIQSISTLFSTMFSARVVFPGTRMLTESALTGVNIALYLVMLY